MAHRDEDVKEQAKPEGIVVRLVDVEPFMGLCASVGRFCELLSPNAVEAMGSDAREALSVIQGIMWRLEHASPEKVT